MWSLKLKQTFMRSCYTGLYKMFIILTDQSACFCSKGLVASTLSVSECVCAVAKVKCDGN